MSVLGSPLRLHKLETFKGAQLGNRNVLHKNCTAAGRARRRAVLPGGELYAALSINPVEFQRVDPELEIGDPVAAIVQHKNEHIRPATACQHVTVIAAVQRVGVRTRAPRQTVISGPASDLVVTTGTA